MELFAPNDLSRSKARMRAVDANVEAHVREILNDHYGAADAPHWRIDELTLDSPLARAYRADPMRGGASLFLKSRKGAAGGAQLEREGACADQLARQGVPVPRLVWPRTGSSPVVAVGEDTWLAYGFQEGQHFSGAHDELATAAEGFGHLTRAARDLVEAGRLSVPRADALRTNDLIALVESASRGGSGDSAVAPSCRRHASALETAIRAVDDARERLEATWMPCHLDYHPLNLLTDGHRLVCILDFEDLLLYPALPALGFGGYKLMRQMLVDRALRENDERRRHMVAAWRAGWHEHMPALDASPADLEAGARYRVLALIHLILETTVRKRDDRFNYDLEKHLLSLYEIPLVYRGEP